MSRDTIRPAPDDARASGVCSQRLRQHVLVEREIGDQALQPIVFVLELPQAAELTHAQVRVLLLPGVEGGLTDPQLPAHVPDRGPALGLAQGVGHLRLGEFRALHRSRPFWVDRRRRHFTLVLGCRCFRGGRHPVICGTVPVKTSRLELSRSTRQASTRSKTTPRMARPIEEERVTRAMFISTCAFVVCLVGIVYFLPAVYENIDDPTIATVLQGEHSLQIAPDAHSVFVHYALGWIVSQLSIRFPNILWYGVVVCGLYIVAFTVIGCSLPGVRGSSS